MMNTTSTTTVKYTVAAMALAFFVGVANSQSQTASEDPNTPPQAGEPPDLARQPALEVETEPETAADTSPFDYRSSEEISEDRSVSFPVDI